MPQAIYPGSFSPPTFGHLAIVERAAAIFPSLIIVCSTNEAKNKRWFSEDDCVAMWLRYPLPHNVIVKKFSEMESGDYVMVRGIRNEEDYAYEGRVIRLNHEQFGISVYTHILSDKEHADISSSKTRECATRADFENLSRMAHPAIVSFVLEHAHGFRNIFLVVGRPGSGKSTLLSTVCGLSPNNFRINTDDFSEEFKPLLRRTFGVEDLITLMLTREEEALRLIGEHWLELLGRKIREAPKGSNVFVEAAYGIAKRLYRFVGGKIILVHCSESRCKERIVARGTPEHIQFIDRIPSTEDSLKTIRNAGLSYIAINSDVPLKDLEESAYALNNKVEQIHGKEAFRWTL